jgi:hypothetical protein
MLQAARTSDLYDLIAETLNALAERDDPNEDPLHAEIVARYAEIRFLKDEDRYGVVYFAETCAEAAVEEHGPEIGGA